MSQSRPHIVIFNPDQWYGGVMGCHGDSGAVTPHLDRSVSEDAVSFRWAFCQNPVCTPSRCSFMTGLYPHTLGHRTMFHMLQPHEPMLLDELRRAGYRVWWGGKNDLLAGQHGVERSVDVYYSPERWNGPNTHGERAWRGDPEGSQWYSFQYGRIDLPEGEDLHDHDWNMVRGAVDEILHGPKDQPLCIFLPLQFPHPPYACEEPWLSMIDRQALPPPAPVPDWSQKSAILGAIHQRQRQQERDDAWWREVRATYYAMIARLDHQWGMIVAALRQAGIYDETALFNFSDHGDYTGDYGLVEKCQNSFEDRISRVPLVIKPPAAVGVQPRVCDGLVELIDVPATIYDLAGVEPSYWHFGRSLRPCLQGATEGHRDAVFCEGGRLRGEYQAMELQSVHAVPSDSLYWPRNSVQTDETSDAHGKATMCRTATRKYVRRIYERDELYDLECDPDELVNVIDDPAYREDLLALRERTLTWYQETCDVVPIEGDARSFGQTPPDWRRALERVRAFRAGQGGDVGS